MIAEELDNAGQVADCRHRLVVLPVADGPVVDLEPRCNVLLKEAQVEPALLEMIAHRPQFLRVERRSCSFKHNSAEREKGNASMRLGRGEQLNSKRDCKLVGGRSYMRVESASLLSA